MFFIILLIKHLLMLITKYKNIFRKGYTQYWSREICFTDSVLKINPWSINIKDLNGEKMIGSFYEKEV